jgi:DNA-binding NarL/FixJ family response regulator
MRILVVDGEPLAREGLTRLLGELQPGAMVLEAGSLAAALQTLQRDRGVTLVIADPCAAGTASSGAAARALLGVRHDVVVVLLSAEAAPGEAQDARDAGAFAFLSKRADLQSLSHALAEALERARLPPA